MYNTAKSQSSSEEQPFIFEKKNQSKAGCHLPYKNIIEIQLCSGKKFRLSKGNDID